MLPYKVALGNIRLSTDSVRSLVFISRICFISLVLALLTEGMTHAQDAGGGLSSSSTTASQGSSSGSTTAPATDASGQPLCPGHIPLPAETPSQDTSYQVTPPSVVLPTPILPPLTGYTNAT